MKARLYSCNFFFTAVLIATVMITGCKKNNTPPAGPTIPPDSFYDVPDGFAASTTGGAGATKVVVSTSPEFMAAAASAGSKIIYVSGHLSGIRVNVSSNKTIAGIDSNSGITGNISVIGVSNVIITNLNLTNPAAIGTHDGIEVSGSTNVFINHCTFTDCPDGELDVVRGSDYVTVSWCRFRYVNQAAHNFTNLIGNGDDVITDRGKLHVTMHHNWYDTGCKERMPRVRFGKVHCYNNLYAAINSNYCIGIGNESEIIAENCYFQNQYDTWKDQRSDNSVDYKFSWNNGNVFSGTTAASWATNTDIASMFTIPYLYTMDSGTDIKNKVLAGAGPK
jgi:pectate lyase